MASSLFLLSSLFALFIFASSQNNPYLVPTGYHLDITVPDLATSDAFSGSIEINVTLIDSTKELVLDAENLIVDPASVTVLRLRQGLVESWVNESRYSGVDTQGSLLNISFSSSLSKVNYRIRLNYTGQLRTGSQGFMKVPYLFKGETRYIAVTNLGATNARSVFPCFNNVSHRTQFVLDVTVNKSLVALSNVKHSSVHNVSESTKMFHFGAYPAMPMSQLGWVVFDMSTYVQHTANTLQNTTVHTRAPHGYDNYTTWACDHTAHLVTALGNYTQTFYPLHKLEQIVVPDLPGSTIEGWGILSYADESLLMSPQEISARDSHRILLEVSRGMAGQWFQGITSMDSRDNQWFPQGMKEYLKYTVADMLPEVSAWELQDHMVVEMVQTALALDSNDNGLSGIPLYAYTSGSIIRMLQSVVGDLIFRNSLELYFEESGNKVSKPTDFFDKLEAVRTDLEVNVDLASQTETQIMNSWISATGYPVLNVEINGSQYRISQSVNSTVFVPVTYVLQDSSTVMQKWLQPGGNVVVEGASNSKWILVNVNQTGFYRVNYDVTLWTLLSRQLASDLSRIPRLNRAQLIDDAFMLTHKGLLSLDLVMNLTSYMVKEKDYFPWFSATRNYQHLLDTLYNQTSHDMLQSHLLKLLNNVIEEVGLESKPQDSHTQKLRQALVLETACALGHNNCLKRAVDILNSWMSRTYYEPDLNMALLCAGVSNSSSSVWHELWRAYDVSVSPTVRINILKALSCSKNTTLLDGFLTNITLVRPPVLSSKNKETFLKTLASTSRGANVILDWIIKKLTLKASVSHKPSSTNLSESEPSATNQTESTPTSTTSSSAVPEAANKSVKRSKREIIEVDENISEEEARNILSYALPKLTSVEQGAKLEKLFHDTESNWTNETLLFLEKAITEIYDRNNTKTKMYNGNLIMWLSNAVTTETTSTTTTGTPSDSTSKSDSNKTTVTSTPSAANTSFSNLIVVLLCVVVSFVSRC